MVVKAEQDRVRTLISDTVTLLCRNGLSYKSKFCINALIGITLDENEIFLVDIRETIKNAEAEDSDAADSDMQDSEPSPKTPSRKRKKHRRRSQDNQETQHSESASEAGSVNTGAGVDNDNLDDNSSEPPAKRLVKQEDEEDDDSQDLVFIKDEPAESDLSSFGNISGSQSFQQQQHGDILGNLAQQGQLFATPTQSNSQGPGTWDTSQQSPFSQAMPLPNQSASNVNSGATNLQESPSQRRWGSNAPVSGGLYQCVECGKSLSSEGNLRLHMNNHLGIYKFHCTICSKGFQQKLHLMGHMASAHDIEAMKSVCPRCKKTFSREDKMKRHLKDIHGESSLPTDPPTSAVGGSASDPAFFINF